MAAARVRMSAAARSSLEQSIVRQTNGAQPDDDLHHEGRQDPLNRAEPHLPTRTALFRPDRAGRRMRSPVGDVHGPAAPTDDIVMTTGRPSGRLRTRDQNLRCNLTFGFGARRIGPTGEHVRASRSTVVTDGSSRALPSGALSVPRPVLYRGRVAAGCTAIAQTRKDLARNCF